MAASPIPLWYPDLVPSRQWLINSVLYENGMAAFLPGTSHSGQPLMESAMAMRHVLAADEQTDFDRLIGDLQLLGDEGFLQPLFSADQFQRAERKTGDLIDHLRNIAVPTVSDHATPEEQEPSSDLAFETLDRSAYAKWGVLLEAKFGRGVLDALLENEYVKWGPGVLVGPKQTVDSVMEWLAQQQAQRAHRFVLTALTSSHAPEQTAPSANQDLRDPQTPKLWVARIPNLPTLQQVSVAEAYHFREQHEKQLKRLHRAIRKAGAGHHIATGANDLKALDSDIERYRNQVGAALEERFNRRVVATVKTITAEAQVLPTAVLEGVLWFMGDHTISARDLAIGALFSLAQPTMKAAADRYYYSYIRAIEHAAASGQQ